MHESRPNHYLVLFLASRRELNRSDSSWFLCDPNRSDLKSQNVCAQNFQLQNYSRAQRFWKCCCLQDFNLNHCCTIPRRATVGKIKNPFDRVKEVDNALPDNLWYYASDGSWWVHTDAVINAPSWSYYLYFSMTIYTAKGDVLITVYPSENVSSSLVGANDGW